MEVAQCFVLVCGTRRAKFDKKLQNRVLRNARHANRRSDRTTFNQGRYYPTSIRAVKPIHTDHFT